MIQFKDVIKEQIQILPDSKKWWPRYLYHFTDIKNALGIIDEEWIFCRRSAIVLDRMKSDNASASVLSTSQNAITEYARLYFRPKTPTQYHNEGYKPQGIRSADLNASCPIPDPKKVWIPKKTPILGSFFSLVIISERSRGNYMKSTLRQRRLSRSDI